MAEVEVSQVGAEILSMASEQRSGRDAAWMATFMALTEPEIAGILTEMASADLLESDDGVSYRPTLHGKQALDTWNRAALDRESRETKRAMRHWNG